MKPALTRRYRRRSTSARTEGAFFKKESQPEQSFFGGVSHDSFFQPAVTQNQSIQRKCEKCEDEDKKVHRMGDKKEEEKVMKMEDKKEEEKVQRQPEKKEEEKFQRAADKKEEEKVMKKDDKKEEEKVMKMEDKKEEEKVQKKEAGTTATPGKNVSNYIGSLNGKGNPLSPQANHFFSSKMGYDFSGVKVHTDKEAAESAKAINAKAYTIGKNVVFNEGQFNAESGEGKKLMAHELTHVIQQDVKKTGTLQRKPAAKATPAKTASSAPKLNPYKIDPNACALLLVIHNDEANAKKTAKAIADNCSYNLLLLEPGGDREMKIPGTAGTVDPNGLFPQDVASDCYNDPAGCEQYLKDKASSTDSAEILRSVQIQFFMSIRKFSNNFSLPVVALHNNSVGDTAKYRKQKAKAGVADLKKDIDKDNVEEGKDPVKELREQLDKKFGVATKKELMTPGKTNIFLWCASKDISKCHIGDPDNPDKVIWVTNQADFDRLKVTDVNVAFQSKVPTDPASKSLTDLSTLFPALKGMAYDKYIKLADYIMNLILDFPIISFGDKIKLISDVFRQIIDAYTKEISLLRYVNIETPGLGLKDQKDSDRIDNFRYIAEVLKTLGIYCCGVDPKANEAKIEDSLKVSKTK